MTLTQCNGFREAFLDDVWRECKLLGLLECATLRLLILSELRGVKVLGGGGTGPLPILVFPEVGSERFEDSLARIGGGGAGGTGNDFCGVKFDSGGGGGAKGIDAFGEDPEHGGGGGGRIVLFILAAMFKGEGQGQEIDEVPGSGGGEGILGGGEGLDANREGEEC